MRFSTEGSQQKGCCKPAPGHLAVPGATQVGRGETQRDLWLCQQKVMWGYQSGRTWQCQQDPGGLARSLWVQVHPDVPVPLVQQVPALSPQASGVQLEARAEPLAGASHPAEETWSISNRGQ